MGSIFGGSKPAQPEAPPPPSAPVEEAEFKPGSEDDGTREDVKKIASGKKRLQIPLMGGATAKKSVQTGGK